MITHEETSDKKPSVNSVYTFTSGFKLFLVKKKKKLHFFSRLLYLKEKIKFVRVILMEDNICSILICKRFFES